MPLRTALAAVAFSEAESIVFAAEGLLLGHDFPSTAEFGLMPNRFNRLNASGVRVTAKGVYTRDGSRP